MSVDVGPQPIAVADGELDDLRERLRRTRWPERETVDDWSQGIPLDYVQEVCRYWADEYDWRRVEAELNGYEQLRVVPDAGAPGPRRPSRCSTPRRPNRARCPSCSPTAGRARSSSSSTSSSPLRDPASHGGDPADAFHVVCPTLPGYGFSDKPTAPGWGVERIADAWVEADGGARLRALRRPGRRLGLGGHDVRSAPSTPIAASASTSTW